MKTRIFLPPLPRKSGGLAVLHALGDHLATEGHDVAFAARETAPGAREAVPVLPWGGLRLDRDCCWLVPEGWSNALAPGLAAGARCVVYVQNWAYLLSSLPGGVTWEQLPVHFVSVSDPVAWFVREATGRSSLLLRPGIDGGVFFPAAQDDATDALPVSGTVRIAWMPRKNTALARQIRETVESRLPRMQPGTTLEWVEIHKRTQAEVAALLRSADIFLATGFPEGCPLPPLEALASGCIVAGFSGLGGWDYMRQIAPEAPWACRPWWPLRDVSWGGNGFYAADADVPAAALAVEAACALLRKGGPELAAVRRAARRTASAYSPEEQRKQVVRVWRELAATASMPAPDPQSGATAEQHAT